MNYIAKKDGFIGGFRRRKGDVFRHEGKPGKWMEPVKDQAKDHSIEEVQKAQKTPKAKRKESEPQTFSELAHQDAEALSMSEV